MIDVTVTDRTMTVVAEGDITGPQWVRILNETGLLGSVLDLQYYAIDDDGAEILHYNITSTDTTVEVSA